MFEHFQQLALMNALLVNWDGIRLRMEPLSPAAAERLAELGRELGQGASADDLARIVDKLLDFTSETPAGPYVRELVARSGLGGRATGLRGVVPPAQVAEEIAETPDSASQTAANLARALTTTEVGFQRVPVFFATNRKPGSRAEFLGDPADRLSFGLASVTIPLSPKHKIGCIETPHWWTLFPEKHAEERFITIAEVEGLERADFLTRVASAATSNGTGADARELLVFLHGYNVTFEEAARRAAQFACDMSFPGIVVLFSWPSMGGLMHYAADEERAWTSADRFVEFLGALEGGPWPRVHLVAHSMGNRVMLLGLADNPRPAVPLGQLVFVAADVYVDLFETKWRKLLSEGDLPATSYISRRDWALRVSHFLHQANRIGFLRRTPYLARSMDTVDATWVDTSLLGHAYFASERSLLTDLGLLVRKGLYPADRGLHPDPAREYWIFPR